MDKILFINACVRPCSRTRQLAESVLKKLDGPVEEVCLDGTTLSALGLEGIEKREQASQKPLHCKLEGKRRSTTKVVVTQDFSPALDSSTTDCDKERIFDLYGKIFFILNTYSKLA